MTDTNIKTAIYNYWEWFESQYIDEDTLPSGMYRAPDGDVVNKFEIFRDFLDDLNEKLNEVVNEDIAPKSSPVLFRYDILNPNEE